MWCRIHNRLEDLVVDSDRDAERCFGEALHKRSERNVSIHEATMVISTRLIAPAAVPNVFPKFLSNQSHSVHAVRTQRRRGIEELRQDLDVGGIVWGITG